nr:uncharacterized protein LOC117274884 [Nicotiana tomentosiformis]
MNVGTTMPRGFRTNYSVNNNRPRPFYDFCKRLGHTKDKCFKLHGYPQHFNRKGAQNYNLTAQNDNQYPRNNKGKSIAANIITGVQGMPSDVMTNKGEDLEHQDSHSNQNMNLSKEQYDQVVRLLQHFQSDGAGDTSSNTNAANGTVKLCRPLL